MELSHWLVLGTIVVTLLAADLLILPRFGKAGSMRRALLESAAWIACGLGFAGYVWADAGGRGALEYLTAYLIEKSLSVDNLFVFAAAFEYFHIQRKYQHRVLFWGILGALVFRGLFIFGGIALLESVKWIGHVFGAILIFTGVRLGIHAFKRQQEESRESAAVRLAAKVLPVDRHYQGGEFWTRGGKAGWCVTPLFLALVAIESSDIVFAVDSVPAVLAVTRDRFLAYSSNVFAILGLRALYSVLAGAIKHLPLIRPALAVLLVLVGVKMIVAEMVELPVWLPLAAIGALLGAAIGGSLWLRRRGQGGHTRARKAA